MAADNGKSFWGYARAQGGEDAVRMLEEAAREEEQAEKTRKIDQLRQFSPVLSEEELVASLEENSGDVDAATMTCLMLHDERVEQRKREEQAEVRRRQTDQRRRDARATAEAQIADMFSNVSLEQRTAVLEKHDGDSAAAIDELLQLVCARDAEAEARLAEIMHQDMLNALKQQYPFRTDIQQLLEANNWSSDAVLTIVQREQGLQMIREVQTLCPLLTSEELFALYTSDEVHSDHDVFRRKAMVMQNQRKKQQAKALAAEAAAAAKASGAAPATPTAATPVAAAPPAAAPVAPEERERQLQAEVDRHAVAFAETVRVAVDRVQASVQPLMEATLDAATAAVFPQQAAPVAPAVDAPTTPVAARADGPGAVEAAVVEAGPATPTATLILSEVAVPNAIKVTWNTAAPATTSDYISLAPAGTADGEQVTYKYNAEGKASGEVVFDLPPHCGEYEFRYHHKASLFASATVLGRSRAIHVGPRFTLKAEPAPAAEGAAAVPNKIVVSFRQEEGEPFTNAWVGMYTSKDSAHKDYIKWEWCRGVSGALTFDAPKIGTFYFRVFAEKAYVMAGETSVTLEAQDAVSISRDATGKTTVKVTLYSRDPAKDGVWVGVYRSEETNYRHYRRSARVTQLGESTFVFKTPIHAGAYDARLMCNGYEFVMLSKHIMCEDNSQWFAAKSQ